MHWVGEVHSGGGWQTKTRRRAPAPKKLGGWAGKACPHASREQQGEQYREARSYRGLQSSALGRGGGEESAWRHGKGGITSGGAGERWGSRKPALRGFTSFVASAASIDQSSRRSRGGAVCVCQEGRRAHGHGRRRPAVLDCGALLRAVGREGREPGSAGPCGWGWREGRGWAAPLRHATPRSLGRCTGSRPVLPPCARACSRCRRGVDNLQVGGDDVVGAQLGAVEDHGAAGVGVAVEHRGVPGPDLRAGWASGGWVRSRVGGKIGACRLWQRCQDQARRPATINCVQVAARRAGEEQSGSAPWRPPPPPPSPKCPTSPRSRASDSGSSTRCTTARRSSRAPMASL